MSFIQPNYILKTHQLGDDGRFPNSVYPVLHYRGIFDLPALLAPKGIRSVFAANNWSNFWDAGIFGVHHYHSISHEVLAIYKGQTALMLGGEKGITLNVDKGDVLVIPAGVAHRNLGDQNQLRCIGAYPDGRSYDMNYGLPVERPAADNNIRNLPIPLDPVFGSAGPLLKNWSTPIR